MKRITWRSVLMYGLAAALLPAWAYWAKPAAPVAAAEKESVDKAALERTRNTVKLLDDVYKGFVVNITATYVDQQDKVPAAKVAKKVFKHMEDKGWHAGRLVDATGEPANSANKPKTEFEKKAVAQINAGKAYYEEVGTDKAGKPVLRAATLVPVVMKQCQACHPGKKEGEPLGAIVYELPIR